MTDLDPDHISGLVLNFVYLKTETVIYFTPTSDVRILFHLTKTFVDGIDWRLTLQLEC
jgi:hypothetical protein